MGELTPPSVPTNPVDVESYVPSNPCAGFSCPAAARCVAWSAGPRCITRAEDAVPFWPDDPCDSATCPHGTYCSLSGAGFECLPRRDCHTVTVGASPECRRGQRCTPARGCGAAPCPGAAERPFCAFEPPRARGWRGPAFMAPAACEQYLASATACLPEDLQRVLSGALAARLGHRLHELQDGAARDRLEDECEHAAFQSSTWCEVPAAADTQASLAPASSPSR